MWNASRFCVSSLRRGHANLLCIVPILVYVPPNKRVQGYWKLSVYMERVYENTLIVVFKKNTSNFGYKQ